MNNPVWHVLQDVPFEHVLQVESQIGHFPSDKYFPGTHPGLQVD